MAKSPSVRWQDVPEQSLVLKPSSLRPGTFAQAIELFNQFVTVDRLLQAPQSRLPLNLSAAHQQQLRELLAAYQQALEAIKPSLQKFIGCVWHSGVGQGSVPSVTLTAEEISAFETALKRLSQVISQLQTVSEALTQTPRLDTFNFAMSTLFSGIAVLSAALSLVSFLVQLAIPPLLPLLVALMTACASFAIHIGNKLYEIQCQNQLKDWHQDRKVLNEFVHQLQLFKDSAMWQQISQVAVAQQKLEAENAQIKQRFEQLERMVLAAQQRMPHVEEAFEHATQIFVETCSTQGLSDDQIQQEVYRKVEAALAAYRANQQQWQQQAQDNLKSAQQGN